MLLGWPAERKDGTAGSASTRAQLKEASDQAMDRHRYMEDQLAELQRARELSAATLAKLEELVAQADRVNDLLLRTLQGEIIQDRGHYDQLVEESNQLATQTHAGYERLNQQERRADILQCRFESTVEKVEGATAAVHRLSLFCWGTRWAPQRGQRRTI
jgi:hypothetical protein